jgi:hypothetical protein
LVALDDGADGADGSFCEDGPKQAVPTANTAAKAMSMRMLMLLGIGLSLSRHRKAAGEIYSSGERVGRRFTNLALVRGRGGN